MKFMVTTNCKIFMTQIWTSHCNDMQLQPLDPTISSLHEQHCKNLLCTWSEMTE